MHTSAGAIIKNEKNEILLIDRVKIPFGWAAPAGHVEAGESPEEALKREVKEEVDLDVLKFHELFHEVLPWNNCARHEGHDWYLYEVDAWQGKAIGNKNETKGLEWVKKDDLKNIKLEEVWQYWFKKLNYKI